MRTEPHGLSAATQVRASELQAVDIAWLVLAVLIVIGSGFGLRDPWPADEPRFALIARDMLATGEWFFPRVGGDLYPDKPPLFFWLLAAAGALIGSLRWSFLLPSLVAACGTTFLVYDLARRLAGRVAGLYAAALLICTLQFVITMRSAQIDATLCLLTTLALYGFLRHLLVGPAWGWYFIGGLASGLGVITKGVGFLPLLVLLPYAILRARRFSGLAQIEGGARWGLAAVGFLLGVAVWLVPMLVAVASSGDPELAAYRDGILFRQTVERYASAWHHLKPWYYFLVEVIPPLWLPFSVLLFWLVPCWRKALRARDARVWLPLGWAIVTLIFFSLSSGKRGIYIMPALPAAVLAAAPYLPELFRKRGVQRVSLALAAVLVVAAHVLIAGHALHWKAVDQLVRYTGLSSTAPILAFAAAGGLLWLVAWRRSPLLAWPAVLTALMLVWAYGVVPQINDQRSGRAFMERVLAAVPEKTELGLAAYKEQFLLYVDRPVVNFGHGRYAETQSHVEETHDAARWLNSGADRVLLLPEALLSPCFASSPQTAVGETSRESWFLVGPPAAANCASEGDPKRAIQYNVRARPATLSP